MRNKSFSNVMYAIFVKNIGLKLTALALTILFYIVICY